MKFEKIVEFSPAFDKRNPEPSKDYGIGGVEIRFVLKGKLGAVQFLIGTQWYLPAVQQDLYERGRAGPSVFRGKVHVVPDGYDAGYHSPKPMYEDQDPVKDSCPYLDGKTCYYDGSGLRADEWVKETLLPKGSDGIWEVLEEEYEYRFGKKKAHSGDVDEG